MMPIGLTEADLKKSTRTEIDEALISDGNGELVSIHKGDLVKLLEEDSFLLEKLGRGPYRVILIAQWRCDMYYITAESSNGERMGINGDQLQVAS